MKKRLLLVSLFLLLLTACQPYQETERFSFIEVVEQKEEAELSQIEDIDLILKNSDIIIGLDQANERYPSYNFEASPAYIVFEYTGFLTNDMILFTYDKEEAVTFLEELIQAEKDREDEFN
ncbi:hypothetical protein [Sutcliffiella rhizosphaerae]|uniref:Uncharacterized protein n=1 Tax=Sutcliffiella rhizosphaerae TaxID=2880967 RepID=A0ABN8A997_9BACI|nr:hypothetical protein [Sutcliffiella rhizosphaerae]CAG9621729.1 hypothetical protein BACCIP111883_02502 [Sutcliffiella rhizosphaerae]